MRKRELFDLSGKVAVVTGGNSGIGLGLAAGIADAGGDVMVWGRRPAQNHRAVDDLRVRGVRAEALEVDVSDEEQVTAAVTETAGIMGRIDCAVINAGIKMTSTPFVDLTSANYHELLATNQHGAFYTARECVRWMVAQRHGDAGGPGGSLILCGSIAVVSGLPRQQHYAAAKGALVALTRSIAVEYAHRGIRANMILPGAIVTGLDGEAQDRSAAIPMRRHGTPVDLQGVGVYLMSDASSYHTGDILTVDGGLSIALPWGSEEDS